MTATHAAAGRQSVTDQFVILNDGDESHALGENVDVVHRRDDEAHLEFPGEVGLAVERVDEVFVLGVVQVELHAIDPNGVVGLGLREQGLGDLLGIFEHLLTGGTNRGHGRGHDVAVHVAAGREGVDHGLVDLAHERAKAIFDDTVELDALSSRQSQGVVGALGGQVVQGDPLPGAQDAAGDAAPDHPDVLFTTLAQVAVVLLVNAVKLEKLLVVCREAGGGCVGKRGGDVPSQGRDRRLQFFVAAGLFFRGSSGAHFQNACFFVQRQADTSSLMAAPNQSRKTRIPDVFSGV